AAVPPAAAPGGGVPLDRRRGASGGALLAGLRRVLPGGAAGADADDAVRADARVGRRGALAADALVRAAPLCRRGDRGLLGTAVERGTPGPGERAGGIEPRAFR